MLFENMTRYKNSLPQFTAGASLLSGRSAEDFTVYDRVDYITPSIYSQMMSEKITPQITEDQCNALPCSECNPYSCEIECPIWRPWQKECATRVQTCYEGRYCYKSGDRNCCRDCAYPEYEVCSIQ